MLRIKQETVQKQILRCIALFIAVLGLLSCGTSTKKAVPLVEAQMRPNKTAPTIKNLRDMGALEIPLGSQLPLGMGDERISPGEWILIEGTSLGTREVSIDGTVVSIDRYFEGQPLLRIPTGLSPRQEHTLTLNTEKGSTQTHFYTHHYIVVSDTDGKAVHLVRSNARAEGGVEEDWLQLEEEFKRPLFNVIGPDSRFLYVFDVIDAADKALIEGETSYKLDISVYHLAAPEKPQRIAKIPLLLASAISDVQITRSRLLLLGTASVQLLDLSSGTQVRELAMLALPKNDNEGKTRYADAIFFDGDKKMAALDSMNNVVAQIDIVDSKLILKETINTLPGKSLPFSVDLEPDPVDPSAFWVLQTPNYRISGSKLAETYKRLIKNEQPGEDRHAVYQLQKIETAAGSMQLGRTVPTPQNYAAYFAVAGRDGRFYVSTTKMEFFAEEFNEGSKAELLQNVKRFLWDTVSFGRIMAINLDSGEAERVASGVGVYYHLVDVPDIGPVFSLLKFGPALSVPYITPTWGLGVKSTGIYAKRKMNKFAVFPPYSVGQVAYQF